MTEKKKRGLLSWLGFGDEEQQAKQAAEETKSEIVEEVAEQAQTVDDVQPEPQADLAEAEAELSLIHI